MTLLSTSPHTLASLEEEKFSPQIVVIQLVSGRARAVTQAQTTCSTSSAIPRICTEARHSEPNHFTLQYHPIAWLTSFRMLLEIFSSLPWEATIYLCGSPLHSFRSVFLKLSRIDPHYLMVIKNKSNPASMWYLFRYLNLVIKCILSPHPSLELNNQFFKMFLMWYGFGYLDLQSVYVYPKPQSVSPGTY